MPKRSSRMYSCSCEACGALPWRGEGDDVDLQHRPEYRCFTLASGSRSSADGPASSGSWFPDVSTARSGARGDRLGTGATAGVEDQELIRRPPRSSGWDGALQICSQVGE